MGRRRIIGTARLTAAAAALYLAWRVVRPGGSIELAGRVVLITGGSRGLGLLLARDFARHGCKVAICARDERELARAREDLAGRGADVLALPCDVSDRAQVAALVAHTLDRFGHIDILVNNASVIQVGPLETMAVQDFEHAMAVNFWGGVYAALEVLPHMRRRREGRIVNITSIGGKVAVPHLLPYDCAKFATVGFSEGLRAELARNGVAVTTVVPGLMRTGSPVNALFKGRQEGEFTWFSIGDSLRLTSMDAERAARRIVVAARRGEAEVTLGWQARLLRLAHDLFPGAMADVLGLVNRLLPAPERGAGAARGMQLASALSPSPLTELMNEAAREYNQFGGAIRPSAEHARRIGLTSPPH